MTAKETIETWRWRIPKAWNVETNRRMRYGEFAVLVGIAKPAMSSIINGTLGVSIERFDLIEEKLKELGV